ncbi:OsmC family protein [Ilumatobacter sp.]|uniref:OsmC family protein n=1 Tax=Ilumatobacter sp. TaxID=1967498 RepID=UPI003C4CB475
MTEEVNGVPCDKMFGAIAKVREDGDLAQFRFSAQNEWIEGTASRSSIYEWHGMGGDHTHVEEYSFNADHPTLGHGHGPTPQEFVLHALAACVTAGIATGAAARNITVHKISSRATADIDVRGVLGVDPDVRKGFSNVDVEFDIDADCDDAQKDALLAGGAKYSALFDMLANPTEVNITRAPSS